MHYISVNENRYMGCLADNPVLETSANGKAILHFQVICSRPGLDTTKDYIPCFAADKNAIKIAKNLKKGSFIYIEGRNQSVRKKIKDILVDTMEVYVQRAIFVNSPYEESL